MFGKAVCNSIQRRMWDYLTGEIAAETHRLRIEKHVAECATCRVELGKKTDGLAAVIERGTPLMKSLASEVIEQPVPERRANVRRAVVTGGAIVAAIALLCLGTILWTRMRPVVDARIGADEITGVAAVSPSIATPASAAANAPVVSSVVTPMPSVRGAISLKPTATSAGPEAHQWDMTPEIPVAPIATKLKPSARTAQTNPATESARPVVVAQRKAISSAPQQSAPAVRVYDTSGKMIGGSN